MSKTLLIISLAMGLAWPGSALAADIASQLDLPPFDKAAMDGYAVPGGENSLDPLRPHTVRFQQHMVFFWY